MPCGSCAQDDPIRIPCGSAPSADRLARTIRHRPSSLSISRALQVWQSAARRSDGARGTGEARRLRGRAADAREWSLGEGVQAGEGGAIEPDLLFLGKGQYALEVMTARSAGRPTRAAVRALWQRRHGKRPSPVVLVVAYPGGSGTRASLCGPAGDQPPVIDDVELAQAERLCAAALAEPNRHTAQRMLSAALPEVDAPMPGIRNAGMLATHELETGVPTRPDWAEACARGQRLAGLSGRRLVEGLGYSVTEHAANTSILTDARGDRAIAVFLQEHEGFEEGAERFGRGGPVSDALAQADLKNLPWVVLTRGRQIRLHSRHPDLGVGRKGREQTFLELNLALLTDAQAGYLPLLFGAEALVDGGSFARILADSADYAAALGARLRDRVYTQAVPTLATAIARRSARRPASQADLDAVYEQALVVLFRLLFVAYAEDKDLLPYRSNDAYRGHALKTMARDLAGELRSPGGHHFDAASTRRWREVRDLWAAVHRGEDDWGVPAYDGGLFSGDAAVNPAGAALAELELTNRDLGPALSALLVDIGPEGPGPVDFRSLSVREFGTIYEGLLESSLSIAPSDLAVDAKDTYLPARAGQQVVVEAGEVYSHNRSGVRKSTGSYFTKPFAVEHLLDTALEPALDDHLARLAAHLDRGDEAAAADAFFDFRCVDLAMGSGHFLVAAVDRIEARLSAFLALRPIPQVEAELTRLRDAALERLGPLASSVEIEQSSLLRRQVARRCVYGVDRNGIASSWPASRSGSTPSWRGCRCRSWTTRWWRATASRASEPSRRRCASWSPAPRGRGSSPRCSASRSSRSSTGRRRR